MNMSKLPKPARAISRIPAALTMTSSFLFSSLLLATPGHAWEMRVCADPDYLPQSHRDASGYENKIAAILADELGAELTFAWWPLSPSMVTEQLREGHCDMMVGVPDGRDGVIPTIAYYRSPFAFVYRADAGYDISSFDDEVLKDLKIGVTTATDNPHLALNNRGLNKNVTSELIVHKFTDLGPFGLLVDEVANKVIDVAVPWGPVAGYYGAQYDPPLKVVPAPEFDMPFTPMYRTIVVAVRMGDEALRDQLDLAIAKRWDDIYAVLEEYHVPTLYLERPTITLGENQQ